VLFGATVKCGHRAGHGYENVYVLMMENDGKTGTSQNQSDTASQNRTRYFLAVLRLGFSTWFVEPKSPRASLALRIADFAA
jgi:hypothetical protein